MRTANLRVSQLSSVHVCVCACQIDRNSGRISCHHSLHCFAKKSLPLKNLCVRYHLYLPRNSPLSPAYRATSNINTSLTNSHRSSLKGKRNPMRWRRASRHPRHNRTLFTSPTMCSTADSSNSSSTMRRLRLMTNWSNSQLRWVATWDRTHTRDTRARLHRRI